MSTTTTPAADILAAIAVPTDRATAAAAMAVLVRSGLAWHPDETAADTFTWGDTFGFGPAVLAHADDVMSGLHAHADDVYLDLLGATEAWQDYADGAPVTIAGVDADGLDQTALVTFGEYVHAVPVDGLDVDYRHAHRHGDYSRGALEALRLIFPRA